VKEGTSNQQASNSTQQGSNGQQLKTHDAKGNPIDRTPPEHGQLHTKKDWCGDPGCQCWGNHKTEDHKEWSMKMKEKIKKR
jgi:hypothetical protein